jgi:hypothetical protein
MFAADAEVLIPCKDIAYGHDLESERIDGTLHNGNSGPIMGARKDARIQGDRVHRLGCEDRGWGAKKGLAALKS